MSETTVVLKVVMSCQGCVGAVQRVLGKMEGVDSFDINMEEQKVTVKGNVQPEAVLQTVSKTGKKTSLWEPTPTTTLQGNPVEAANTVDATPETKPAEAEPETKATDEAVVAA